MGTGSATEEEMTGTTATAIINIAMAITTIATAIKAITTAITT